MKKAMTVFELLIFIVILGGLAAVVIPSADSSTGTQSSSTYHHDPYADKNCSEQYKTFMKRNNNQYEEQGQIVRTNSGSLPQEARQILRQCRDALGGLDDWRVSILRNFAFQN